MEKRLNNNVQKNTKKKTDNAISPEQMKALLSKLEDMECTEINCFDIRGVFSYADYILIATTRSDVQRKGILDKFPDFLEEVGLEKYISYCLNKSQLNNTGGWVLIDFKDFIVHLMTEEARDFYEIDKIFFEAKQI